MGEWTLLSPAMLGFAIAAAVPVALYWWHRPRRLELPWAATLFLERALAKEGSRRSWLQWLLLAIRVLTVSLLAVAWSEPSWRSQSVAKEPAIWHLFVFDGSLSMQAEPQAGESAWERARRLASRFVEQNRSQAGYSILVARQNPEWIIEQPQWEPQRVLAELSRLNCGQGTANLPVAVNAIAESIARIRATVPVASVRVNLFTDCQGTTWDPKSIAEMTQGVNSTAIDWELHDLGTDLVFNSGVTSLRYETPWNLVNTPVLLSATIEHQGAEERTLSLRWSIAGEQQGREAITLQPGERKQVTTTHRFTKPGEYVVTVEVDADAFSPDNIRRVVVPVREQVQILALGGRREETQPFTLAIKSREQTAVVVTAGSDTRSFQQPLAPFDLVLLANWSQLSSVEEERLAAYVAAGGGVIIAAGDLTSAELGERTADFLPATLKTAETFPKPLLFDPLKYQHDVVKPFRGFERSGLLTTPTWCRWKLQLRDGAETCLAFSDGSPAVVARRFGSGQVIVTAIPFSGLSQVTLNEGTTTPWSAFDTWPSFVPLIHELTKFAARGGRDVRSVEVGVPLQGEAESVAEVSIVLPDETTQLIATANNRGQPTWSFAETNQIGVYKLMTGTRASEGHQFVVHPPSAECKFTRVDPAAITQGWQNRPTANDTLGSPSTVAGATSILVVVLALLCVESSLAWFLGRETT